MVKNSKNFVWDEQKNQQLKQERGLCFEDCIAQFNQGNILDVIKHPNFKKYPNQSIYIVKLSGYVCMLPSVLKQDEVFLKTIIPS